MNAAAPAPAPVHLTFAGNSLAVGVGAARRTDTVAARVYRAILAARPKSTLTNVAISGATIEDVHRYQVDRIPSSSTVVVVMVGANDVLRGMEPTAIGSAYAALLDAIRRRVPRAHIVACGIPDVGAAPALAHYAEAVSLRSREANAAVAHAAGTAGATFVDFFSRDGTRLVRGLFSADGFHPNDDGYARLAEVLAPVVTRVASGEEAR